MTLAHTAPTLLDGSHLGAFLVGICVGGLSIHFFYLWAERNDEPDLPPLTYPRSVPPASAHSHHLHITHMAVSQNTSIPSPNPFASKLALYDVERDEPGVTP